MEESEDPIFKNNPIYMKSLIGKEVSLDLIDIGKITGKVYVIDPIFKTVVLHKKTTDSSIKIETAFILHHAIKSLEVVSDEIDENYLKDSRQDVEMLTSDETRTKREKLRKWFENMQIRIEESGDYLKIDNHVLIAPPYGIENCICSNTTVLNKIRRIISLMPADFT